jgi:ABC-2 type transport system ATP-binding protein
MPEPAIEARQAGKRFGGDWVVRGLDFAVEPGSIFGLFGPSGAGKTTTLRLLLGLLAPDEGEIRVLGTTPDRFSARTRGRIGYLPQLFVLYPELTTFQNLNLVASLYRLGWWRRRKSMRRVLELVELWPHRAKTARTLSGGMQRRLELAAALVHEPELLVVDEPTAGIDPILRARFWEHFRGLRAQGRTLVVTSQYVTEAEHCDRIAVLAHGQIIAQGSPDEVRRQAMGGEIVEVVTDGLRDGLAERLGRLAGVRAVRQLSYQQLELTVERAGEAIPPVLTMLGADGVAVRSIQERRPSFEEVFVRLVGNFSVAPPE